jgi:hypothetical protein
MVWCASNYIPSKRTIISKIGFVLIEINPQSIYEMLRWPLNHDIEILNKIVLAKCFKELKPKERVDLLQTYMWINLDAPSDNVILESRLFPKIPRQIIYMISMILGKDSNLVVDELVLVNMISICPFIVKPLTKFNYV